MLSPLGFEATRWLFLLGGALFIGLVHRFLRIHATLTAARITAILLATDWTFVFFRAPSGDRVAASRRVTAVPVGVVESTLGWRTARSDGLRPRGGHRPERQAHVYPHTDSAAPDRMADAVGQAEAQASAARALVPRCCWVSSSRCCRSWLDGGICLLRTCPQWPPHDHLSTRLDRLTATLTGVHGPAENPWPLCRPGWETAPASSVLRGAPILSRGSLPCRRWDGSW